VKLYDLPVYDEPVGGVAECPELRDALEAGEFRPSDDRFVVSGEAEAWVWDQAEDIGRHQQPGKRAAYVYRLQRATHATDPSRPVVWHVFGEYCRWGRATSDADYLFLDGGGYFSNRAAALWAIHLWLAHLNKIEATTGQSTHGA
jgi:hypothetical protein